MHEGVRRMNCRGLVGTCVFVVAGIFAESWLNSSKWTRFLCLWRSKRGIIRDPL